MHRLQAHVRDAILILSRTSPANVFPASFPSSSRSAPATGRFFSLSGGRLASGDSRISGLGREIGDDYARIRDHYDAPKHPIVLAHGLLGFSELRLLPYIPPIHYWHGIKEALDAQGVQVVTTSVPPTSSIEQRAARLADQIAAKVPPGQPVNIVAHSMGGLDARYLISHLARSSSSSFSSSFSSSSSGIRVNVEVKSLVTVATPHRGSAFADYLFDNVIGTRRLPTLYAAWERATGWDVGAFAQLTRRYMQDEFNPHTPDGPGVRYFSYGAMIGEAPDEAPPLLSPFRAPWAVLRRLEGGANDGLVSVESSRWGDYRGTLVGVNHIDLINWSNRMRYAWQSWIGRRRKFNAVALYLDIADMLAKEGL